jgi:hypothetical protein
MRETVVVGEGMIPRQKARAGAAGDCVEALAGSAQPARSPGGVAAKGERASSGGRANLELRMLGRSCRLIGAAVVGGVTVTGVSGTVEVARVTSAVQVVDGRSGRGGVV